MSNDIIEKMPVITDAEFMKISRALEEHHAIFYKFWEMGRPIFSRSIKTACVSWDKETQGCTFIFNPDFWESLDFYNRLWVITHEALHLVLNHIIRFGENKKSHEIANIAADIVVNHLTVNQFGFDRDRIEDEKKYCWIDTVFPLMPLLKDDKHFEHYIRLLMQKAKQQQQDKKGKPQSGGDGSGSGSGGGDEEPDVSEGTTTVDQHEGMPTEEEMKHICDSINDSLTDGEKDEIKDVIKKHFQVGDGGSKEWKPANPNASGGNAENCFWTFYNVDKNIKKKRKWETIIQEWVSKRRKPTIKGVERWGHKNRRLASWSTGRLHLPSEMDVDTFAAKEHILNVWFMLDTSPSCDSLKERFFKAAFSLPENRFETNLFSWNTSVTPIDKKNKKVMRGSGTKFSCMENYIQAKMKEESIEYPDAIFVVTDGRSFDYLHTDMPERWYFFLSENYIRYIPDKSHHYNLKDFE